MTTSGSGTGPSSRRRSGVLSSPVSATALSPTLRLDVHADNLRARAAYVKRGFVLTGKTLPYELDTSQFEVEMIKRLR